MSEIQASKSSSTYCVKTSKIVNTEGAKRKTNMLMMSNDFDYDEADAAGGRFNRLPKSLPKTLPKSLPKGA